MVDIDADFFEAMIPPGWVPTYGGEVAELGAWYLWLVVIAGVVLLRVSRGK